MAKVCLIEDDAVIRKSLSRILQREGHLVQACCNGREGLDVVEKRLFDLIVTDIIMPEMEGIELIRRIRAIHPDIKIAAMSGGGRVGNMDFLKIAKSLGADEVIYKPATKTEFLKAVNNCLGACLA